MTEMNKSKSVIRKKNNKVDESDETELARLQFTMTRLDHYFDSINNKAAVYLALNTFLTGGITTMMSSVSFGFTQNYLFWASGTLLLLLGLASLTILAYTSLPFLSNKIESLYYFGSISSCSSEMFHALTKRSTRKSNLKDLREQVYRMSCGLKSKFDKLRIIGRLLIVQFILLLPFLFSLIFNI
jgi:hypothetical protein